MPACRVYELFVLRRPLIGRPAIQRCRATSPAAFKVSVSRSFRIRFKRGAWETQYVQNKADHDHCDVKRPQKFARPSRYDLKAAVDSPPLTCQTQMPSTTPRQIITRDMASARVMPVPRSCTGPSSSSGKLSRQVFAVSPTGRAQVDGEHFMNCIAGPALPQRH